MTVIEGSLAYFIAGVLVVAAFHKLADTKKFYRVLADYQVLSPSLVKLVAPALPVIEFATALLLCLMVWFDYFSGMGAIISMVLFSTYTAALIKVYLEGKALEDCGCGGSANQPISLWPILRNFVLIGACVYLYLSGGSASTANAYWVLSVCFAIVLTLVYWTFEELHKNTHYISLLEKHYD